MLPTVYDHRIIGTVMRQNCHSEEHVLEKSYLPRVGQGEGETGRHFAFLHASHL